MTEQRKLTAAMFTDIIGCMFLLSKDEKDSYPNELRSRQTSLYIYPVKGV